MGSFISTAQVLSKKGSGEFNVGSTDVMIDGSDLGDRGLFMRLYYPTIDETNDINDHPLWLPKYQYAHGLGDYLGQSAQKMNFITSNIVGDKRDNSIKRANLLERGEKFPVIVFSHGLGGSRSFYSTFCTSIASHGYIIAAVEHRDQSACWTYQLVENDGVLQEQGIKIKLIDSNDKNEQKIRNQQVCKRVSECVKALNVLEQLNLGKIPKKILLGEDFNWNQFKNRMNISAASVVGHSFGGATALASISYTTDFQKAVVLDGWMFPLDSSQQEQAKQPVMFLNVGDWQWKENLNVMQKIMPHNEKNVLFTLRGAVHQCFSDFPLIFPQWLARRFGVQGNTDSGKCLEAAIDLTVGFLNNGKFEAQKRNKEKYSSFISEELYGREKFKL